MKEGKGGERTREGRKERVERWRGVKESREKERGKARVERNALML